MGISTEPIEQIDWFERYENSPCLNHQPINSDRLEGAIRNPFAFDLPIQRGFSESIQTLPIELGSMTAFKDQSNVKVIS